MVVWGVPVASKFRCIKPCALNRVPSDALAVTLNVPVDVAFCKFQASPSHAAKCPSYMTPVALTAEKLPSSVNVAQYVPFASWVVWKTRLPLLRVMTTATGGSVHGTTSVKVSLRLCMFTVHPEAGLFPFGVGSQGGPSS